MKKAFSWLAVNLTVFSLIVSAFVFGNDNAGNLVVAIVWLNLFVSLLLLLPGSQKRLRAKGRSVPSYIDGAFDGVVLAMFAWYGAFVLFAVYFVSTIAMSVTWRVIESSKGNV